MTSGLSCSLMRPRARGFVKGRMSRDPGRRARRPAEAVQGKLALRDPCHDVGQGLHTTTSTVCRSSSPTKRAVSRSCARSPPARGWRSVPPEVVQLAARWFSAPYAAICWWTKKRSALWRAAASPCSRWRATRSSARRRSCSAATHRARRTDRPALPRAAGGPSAGVRLRGHRHPLGRGRADRRAHGLRLPRVGVKQTTSDAPRLAGLAEGAFRDIRPGASSTPMLGERLVVDEDAPETRARFALTRRWWTLPSRCRPCSTRAWPIWIKDGRGRFVMANSAAVKLFCGKAAARRATEAEVVPA